MSLSFSSEAPVLRRDWDGERYFEVLDHAKVDSRDISDGAPLLFGHNDNFHIGTVESVTFAGNRGKAVVRFGRSALAEEKFKDVQDGILKKTSVGYELSNAEPVQDGERDGVPVIRFRNWKPMEVTLCPLPADNSVGVGRDATEQRTTFKLSSIVMKRNLLLDAKVEPGNGPAIITKEDFSRELDEAREILGIQAHYQRTHPEVVTLCEKAIQDKMPIRDFQRKIIDLVSKPTAAAAPTIVASAPNSQRTQNNSAGAKFVSSQAYKDAMQRGFGRGKHFVVEMGDMHSFQQRATFSLGVSDISGSTDIGGTGGIGIHVDPTFNLLGKQPIAVASLFGQGTCTGDQIRIVRQLTLAQAAARVAEGGNKPESQLDVGVVNFPVEKTAVFINVTEEMLTDQSQAASFINADLSYQVSAAEDNYLLNGTGSSQITGILNTSGIQTISGAVNTLDQFKRGKAYVEGVNGVGFAMPDAYLLNPLDWLSASLTKDGNGQYLFGGPGYAPYGVGGYSNVSMMWGLPVVTTTFLTQGTAIVGAFGQGATVFRRAGVSIRSTDSHASNFIANIVTVLAESRFALAVKQPNKFCTITSIPA